MIEAPVSEDDLSTIMVDDFGQSTVDQSEILYEFQTAQNAEEVNRILAEIISDYDCNQLPTSKFQFFFLCNFFFQKHLVPKNIFYIFSTKIPEPSLFP